MNICIEYLYRDAHNYKNWGSVIFTNTRCTSTQELERDIRKNLIDGNFFIAEDLGIPTLYNTSFDPSVDHGWHEYHAIHQTDNESEHRDIDEIFFLLAESTKKALQ